MSDKDKEMSKNSNSNGNALEGNSTKPGRKKYPLSINIARIVLIIVAVFLIGLAVTVFKKAVMGCDPFSCMNTGVSNFIHWKFWVWQLLVNIVLFVPVIIWYRKAIGFGTVFNMVFVGIFSDAMKAPLNNLFLVPSIQSFAVKSVSDGVVTLTMPVRIILLIIGVVILCLGVALYIAADMGMAPYDALAYIFENFTGVNFSYFRIGTDIVCVLIGFIFSYQTHTQFDIIGIGTIITALGTGPIVRFFQNFVAFPLVRKFGFEPDLVSTKKNQEP